jgi:hypothetical protein
MAARGRLLMTSNHDDDIRPRRPLDWRGVARSILTPATRPHDAHDNIAASRRSCAICESSPVR